MCVTAHTAKRESTVLIDLHVHSNISEEGVLEPEEILLKAKTLGLDGVCFVETAPIKSWKELLSLGEYHEVAVLFGRLFSTPEGDFIFYPGKAKDAAKDYFKGEAELTYELLMEQLSDHGLLVAAYPYKTETDNPLGDRIFKLQGLDGIEVRNGSCPPVVNDFALEASFHLKAAGFGGSNTTSTLETLGSGATLFLHSIESQEDLLAAVKAGDMWPVEMTSDVKLRPTPRGRGGGRRDDRRGGSGGRRDSRR